MKPAPGSPPPLIALIGFMGSGKTTVGNLLAASLGWDFVDLDTLIEDRMGRKVTEIFAAMGEEAFRAAESRFLADLGGRDRLVLAAGGGTPVANRDFFIRAATFYLRVSLPTAMARTGPASGRPLLARGPEAVRSLYQSRLPVYASLGTGVDTEGKSPADVAREILSLLKITSQGRDPR